MESLLLDYLDRVGDMFANPQKRVFVGYLASSFVIAAAFFFLTRRLSFPFICKALFDKKVWWSASAKGDYKLLLINQAVMMGLGPRLIGKLAVATLLFESLHVWFDGRVLIWTDAPGWVIAFLFTVTVFLLDDVTKYWLHRILHRWPVLWAFHKVHHTAETLTPFTVLRTHPVEAVLFTLRATLVHAVAIATFLYFFGDRATLIAVLGANAFLFAFNALGSNLRHSHVWLRYGRLVEHVLISPAQHQIHHSIESRHCDRNFGAVLALWDWMGGSLEVAERKRNFALGVAGHRGNRNNLESLYLVPFVESYQSIKHPLRAILGPLTRRGRMPESGRQADILTMGPRPKPSSRP